MNRITTWNTDLRYKPYIEWNQSYIEDLQERMKHSDWRLCYHIQPESGLLNDPNGFSYFNEEWHLFYQAYPMGPVHGVKSWYHVTSKNLVDWKNLGLGMLPDSKFDSHGVYSGSAIPLDKQLLLIYTGNVRDENWKRTSYQMRALMDREYKIVKDTPLLVEPPNGYTQEFRDPQIFIYQDQYFLVIGAQNEQLEGKILTYQSSDAKNWHLMGELGFSSKKLGFMIECPNLLFIEDKVLLIFCPQGLDKNIIFYENIYPNTFVLADAFNPQKNRLDHATDLENLDEGFDIYATQAFNAPDGRTLAISWIGLPEIAYPSDEEGWAHCLSIVKELSIKNGKLLQNPVKEQQELRKAKQNLQGSLGKIQSIISNNKKNVYELILSLTKEAHGTLHLFADEQLNHSFTISFDGKNGKIVVDRSNMDNTFSEAYGQQRTIFLEKKEISLQIFVDQSVCEIFINGGQKVVTSRIFPQKKQTHLFIEGTEGSFSGEFWTLRAMKN